MDQHWASKTGDELAAEVLGKFEDYCNYLRETGLLELYRMAYAAAYSIGASGSHEASKIMEAGEQGELLRAKSNQYRSLLRYLHTSVTSERLNATPKAMNKSARARAQIPAAKAVQEHYMVKKNQAKAAQQCALRALIFGKGYVVQLWDPNDPTTPNGDLGDYEAFSPLEVAQDPWRPSGRSQWTIVARPRNKYDAAAVYTVQPKELPEGAEDTPEARASLESDAAILSEELREKILNESVQDLDPVVSATLGCGLTRLDKGNDLIELHLLYPPTPALPKGRQAIVTAGGTLLFEGDFAYKRLPVSAMDAEELIFGGAVGYTSVWDLLGLQDFRDALLSTAATNFDAFGANDVLIPEGVEIGVEELRDGLNIIRYPAGEFNRPSILEKNAVRDEFFKLRDWMDTDMERTVDTNGVARGEPEASLKSGAALALVQAQAIHFQSPLIEAYTAMIEDMNTVTLRNVAFMSTEDHIAYLAGEQDRFSAAAYSSSSLDMIDCVEIERTPALMRTIGGRSEAADKLLERGLIQTPAQYYQAKRDGRIDGMEDAAKDADLADQVRGVLMTGPAVIDSKEVDPATGMPYKQVEDLPVTMFDHPVLCLNAAKSVLSNLDARKDPAVVAACTAYSLEVLRVWSKAPPDMLKLMGYPLPTSLEMAMTANEPGGGMGKKSQGGKAPPEKPGDQAPAEGSSMPSLPKPAKDPLEGQR